MSGRVLATLGSREPWSGGAVGELAHCVLAPNPSSWTLDGTNTWLLAHGDDVVVVDPGPDDDDHLERIRGAIDGRRLVATLLTHGHADHSAGARSFHDMTGVNVRALDPAHRWGTEGLGEGDTIALGDLVLRVVQTPGHSSDSLCFSLDTLILTGDTVLGRGTAAIIWPDGQLAAYLSSIERLASDFGDAHYLLPGHGPALTDPAHVFADYLEHRLARLAEVREAITAGANSIPALMELVYPDVPEAIRRGAELSLRAHVQFLIENDGFDARLLD
jgi:glyoxylase-like metal-dependent hydrolase (beta-lactamase superfamily II)